MKTQLRSSKVQGFKVLGLILALLLELFNPLNLERASAQTPFYQGKTITMVVASTVGGGYDLWARLTARHIVKYIPGNPSIVVQNMPGAGNIIGANYVYGVAKPDGLTLGAVNPALYFDQLVGRSEVKFDWAKFNWIGSPEKNDVVSYMRADQPLKTIDDCATPKNRQSAAAPAPAPPATTFPGCSKKRSASKPRSSAAIPAPPISNWPSSAAKSFAGRRCSRPILAASLIGVGTSPATCAS